MLFYVSTKHIFKVALGVEGQRQTETISEAAMQSELSWSLLTFATHTEIVQHVCESVKHITKDAADMFARCLSASLISLQHANQHLTQKVACEE